MSLAEWIIDDTCTLLVSNKVCPMQDNERPHAYDLRVWKLSGLVSAYTLAIAVNVGLFVASTCNAGSLTALFIPWIVINFVAILGK